MKKQRGELYTILKKSMLIVLVLFINVWLGGFVSDAAEPQDTKASTGDLIYGGEEGITRAEWVHDLSVIFDFKVEEGNYPDNYYSDLDVTSTYYKDVLMAVEFGVVDIPAGERFLPDELATREFAAQTMNYCLGFERDEEGGYTFTDSGDVKSPEDVQIAVDRGWFALVNGNFLPSQKVSDAEAKKIFEDAQAVWSSTTIDESYTDKFQFASDVIVVPNGTEVTVDENQIVTISNYPINIQSGDLFAVYINGLPQVYTAKSVTSSGSHIIITVQVDENNEHLIQADAQGTTEGDLALAQPVGDSIITYIEGGTEVQGYSDGEEVIEPYASGNIPIKAINIKKNISLSAGTKAGINCRLYGLKIHYNINTGKQEAYVGLEGTAEVTCNASFDAIEELGLPSSLTVAVIPIGGVGSVDVNVDLSVGGKVTLTYSEGFASGVQYTKNGGARIVNNFQKKKFSIAAEASVKAGVTVSANVNQIPFISGRVYVSAGAKMYCEFNSYGDGQKPEACIHMAGFLYAKAGGSITFDFIVVKKSFSKDIDIYTESNSPVRVVRHYEDNKLVSSCTRGWESGLGYISPWDSIYSSDGRGYGSSTGTNGAGEPYTIYTYTLDEDENATITGYKGNVAALMIPTTIDGYTVTTIGGSSFENHTELYSVVIPDSVTEIKGEAFRSCPDLTNITLSNQLVRMGHAVFSGCSKITSIDIPKSLQEANTQYGNLDYSYDGPFSNTGLNSITFEEGTEVIATCLFAGCQELTNISIPNTVITLGAKCFAYCTNLEEVTIPDNVTRINWSAFDSCTSLKQVNTGNGVTFIGEKAFEKCQSLDELTLSSQLTTMQTKAFANTTSLSKVTIPKSLTDCTTGYDNLDYDYSGPFEGSALSEVSFEKGTTEIAGRLFAGADYIVNITIPDTVTRIEGKAFAGCDELQEIEIPGTVTTIDWAAFKACKKLTKAKIGNGVTLIGAGAFMECELLREVTLSNQLEEMRNNAFGKCTSLSEIEIPKSLKKCTTGYDNLDYDYSGPFNESALSEVSFEQGVSSIAPRLFAGTTMLKTITIPQTVTTVGGKAFAGAKGLEEIKVPEGTQSIEWAAFKGCNVLRKVVLADSVTMIEEKTFSECEKLEDIKLSNKITDINYQLFYKCTNLANIELPESVKNIGDGSFEKSGIRNITFPSNLAEVKSYAFSECTSLETVDLGNVQTIKEGAFYGCSALEKVNIPDTIKSIEKNIFNNCDVLSEVTLGSGLTSIPSYAFNQCQNITEIKIPYRVSEIKDHAFTNCVKLTSVTIPRATTTIAMDAFSYPDKMTIYGVPGTYAQEYATSKNIKFVANEINATKAVLNKTEVTLNRGKTDTLIPSITPTDFTDAVVWKSTDSNIVTVTDAGLITAKAVGSATIKLTVGSVNASCKVTVVQPVTSIGLNRTSISLDALATYQLTATANPSNANNKEIKWSSSDAKIATVSDTGLVTALMKGSATITAAAQDGSGVTRTCNVTVNNNAYVITDINRFESPHNYSDNCTDIWTYKKDGVASLTVTFDSRTNIEEDFDFLYIYDKDGNEIGKYTGTQLANASIQVPGNTVKVQMRSDNSGNEWGFKVSNITDGGQITNEMTGFTLNVNTLNLILGETETSTLSIATVEPADTSDISNAVTWTSDNGSVADVSGGIVTAKSEGTATITASITNAKGVVLTQNCIVTVTRAAPTPDPDPEPTPNPQQFSDVSEDAWFAVSVEYVASNGIMTGMNATTFGPAVNLARAQFATILYRMEGSPEVKYINKFPDVSDGQFYSKPVIWANQEGIVGGYSNGYFGPSDNITREQMAVMMYRYAKYKGYDVSDADDLSGFPDQSSVTGFATEAMQWAVGSGLITGTQGRLDPQGNAVRAQCATIIMRFMEKYEN